MPSHPVRIQKALKISAKYKKNRSCRCSRQTFRDPRHQFYLKSRFLLCPFECCRCANLGKKSHPLFSDSTCRRFSKHENNFSFSEITKPIDWTFLFLTNDRSPFSMDLIAHRFHWIFLPVFLRLYFKILMHFTS